MWHNSQYERLWPARVKFPKQALAERRTALNNRCRIDTAPPTPHTTRETILVCAPSNAAIDELLNRVMECGFVNREGLLYLPRIARIGSKSAVMSASAQEVCHPLFQYT